MYRLYCDNGFSGTVIPPGGEQGGSQNGVNASGINGYSMLYGDAYFIFFIASENYDTVSTTYYSSRHLVKTPVQYKNEIAEKRQTSVVCRFIIKNRSMIPPNIWQHIEITLFSVNKCAVIPYKQ